MFLSSHILYVVVAYHPCNIANFLILFGYAADNQTKISFHEKRYTSIFYPEPKHYKQFILTVDQLDIGYVLIDSLSIIFQMTQEKKKCMYLIFSNRINDVFDIFYVNQIPLNRVFCRIAFHQSKTYLSIRRIDKKK